MKSRFLIAATFAAGLFLSACQQSADVTTEEMDAAEGPAANASMDERAGEAAEEMATAEEGTMANDAEQTAGDDVAPPAEVATEESAAN